MPRKPPKTPQSLIERMDEVIRNAQLVLARAFTEPYRPPRREPHPNPEQLLARKETVNRITVETILGVEERQIRYLVAKGELERRPGKRGMYTSDSIRSYLLKNKSGRTRKPTT